MSLLGVIAEYDRERETYIASLEARIEELEAQRREYIDTMMRGVQEREQTTLKLIMAGAFDCLVKDKTG
jgi:hypothetical protein